MTRINISKLLAYIQTDLPEAATATAVYNKPTPVSIKTKHRRRWHRVAKHNYEPILPELL